MDQLSHLANCRPSEWLPIAELKGTQLNLNDRIELTLSDAFGDLKELSIGLEIKTHEQGEAHIWPKLVAEYINRYFLVLRAGRSYQEHGIVPCYGNNTLFATKSSGIVGAKVVINPSEIDLKAHVQEANIRYDHVFPQNQTNYKAGDKVLQPKNGKIYICKPWPFTEFCRLGHTMFEQYEPGFGKNWMLAWDEMSKHKILTIPDAN
jgi:hypothetical protein